MVPDLPLWASRRTGDLWIMMFVQGALFTLPLWVRFCPPALPSNWLTSLSQQQVQIRLIYAVVPRIALGWSGPLDKAGLTHNQLLLMALVDGILGVAAGWVVFQVADRWVNRLMGLAGVWGVWIGMNYFLWRIGI